MNRVFALYFKKSLPGIGIGLAVALLSIPLLSRFAMFADKDIMLFFWVSMALPAAAVILGGMTGAETASETATEAEAALPVSAFSRLAGAGLAAISAIAVIAAVLLVVSGRLKNGTAFIQGGFNLGSAAYLLALLQACAFSFVFGRLSRSMIAGAAAGGGLALLTTTGILASVAVDALLLGDGREAPVKIVLLGVSGLCALFSLKYVSEIAERKARPGFRNVGAAALLLSAGLIAAGGLLAVSKGRAHKLLISARQGDKAYQSFIYARNKRDYNYKLYENPVKGEYVVVGPEGRARVALPGRTKSYVEFFKDPMHFVTETSLAGPDGDVWLVTREEDYRLYYAPPGGPLELQANLGLKANPLLAMFRIGEKSYLAMASRFDAMQYLAELAPGKPVKWEFTGTGTDEGREAVIKKKKASGSYAWFSKDKMSLMATVNGREAAVCRLPYKGASFYHTPLYEAVSSGRITRFFVPLMRNGKTALYYCTPGKAAAPAWDAPEGYMFEFHTNHEGSAYAAVTRRTEGNDEYRVFYALNEAGEMLPPIDADKVFAGRSFRRAVPIKSVGDEVFFLLDGREVVKTDGKKVSLVADLGGKPSDAAAVRDGVLFRDKGGLNIAGWNGEIRRLY